MGEQTFSQRPFLNEIQYNRNDLLGKGNSVVYRGYFNGNPVAVKRIVLRLLSEEDREVQTQGNLDHENVLKILAVSQDLDFR